MMQHVFLHFALGRTTSNAIPAEYERLYTYIGKLVTGMEPTPEDLSRYGTIPIPLQYRTNSAWVYDSICSRMSQWTSSPSIVLCDFTSMDTDDVPHPNLILGISAAINRILAQHSSSRIVVIMNGPIATTDMAADILRRYDTEQRLAVVFDSGEIFGGLPIHSEKQASDILAEIALARKDPLTVMERRFVRYIGHFRWPGREDCTSLYFSGSGCQSSIMDAILAYIHEKFHDAGQPINVLSHCPISPWLDVVLSALNANGQIRYHTWDSVKDHWPASMGLRVLVVLPLVDTGQTVLDIRAYLAEQTPGISVTALAILSTQGEQERKGQLTIGEDNRTTQLDYFLRVGLHRLPDPCTWCQVDEPQDPRTIEPQSFIDAREFWFMVDESGLKKEEDVPEMRRESIGYVPDFPRIIGKNGPLLAEKVRTLVRNIGRRPTNLVFLCPMERGAEELADCLKLLEGFDFLKIPRPIIEVFGETANRKDRDSIMAELNSIPEGVAIVAQLNEITLASSRYTPSLEKIPVVLIDEFVFSGGTLAEMARMASFFSLEVLAKIVLAHFGPATEDIARLYNLNYLDGII